jgi:hypothetical protein
VNATMSPWIILDIVLIVYVVGFVFTVWINLQIPVTPGLLWLRSFLWPLWILGFIQGAPEPMD